MNPNPSLPSSLPGDSLRGAASTVRVQGAGPRGGFYQTLSLPRRQLSLNINMYIQNSLKYHPSPGGDQQPYFRLLGHQSDLLSTSLIPINGSGYVPVRGRTGRGRAPLHPVVQEASVLLVGWRLALARAGTRCTAVCTETPSNLAAFFRHYILPRRWYVFSLTSLSQPTERGRKGGANRRCRPSRSTRGASQ